MKSAQVLLERANQTERRGGEGERGAPASLTPLPARLPAALLAPDSTAALLGPASDGEHTAQS